MLLELDVEVVVECEVELAVVVEAVVLAEIEDVEVVLGAHAFG